MNQVNYISTLICNHQFSNKDFYFPNWKVNHLFIGTFNPEMGEKVPYYYGRSRNKFWPYLSNIFQTKLDPHCDSFFNEIMRIGIGCVDLIHSIKFVDSHLNRIQYGYADNDLLINRVEKTYNTPNIINTVKNNKLSKVYFTNSGSSLRIEQKAEINKISSHCEFIYICSPSPRNPNRNSCLDDWRNKLLGS